MQLGRVFFTPILAVAVAWQIRADLPRWAGWHRDWILAGWVWRRSKIELGRLFKSKKKFELPKKNSPPQFWQKKKKGRWFVFPADWMLFAGWLAVAGWLGWRPSKIRIRKSFLQKQIDDPSEGFSVLAVVAWLADWMLGWLAGWAGWLGWRCAQKLN